MSNHNIISPQAIVALEKALSVIYWYKNDLKRFLYQVLSDNTTILAVIDWNDVKKNIAARVISMLIKNGDKTRPVLIQLLCAVSDFADFSHLEILEGGKEKAKAAKGAVKALRNHVAGFQNIQKEIEEAKLRRENNQKRQDKLNRVKSELEQLKREFFTWSVSTDHQGRGYALEKILYKLFGLYDLDPIGSFKTIGEQIDGAFTFNNEEFLLEAKWRNSPTSLNDLDSFSCKIARRLENTLGLFISMSGFTKEALTRLVHSDKKLVILMDGEDLMAVFEERISLHDMLKRKRREAAQTGNVYLKFRDMIR